LFEEKKTKLREVIYRIEGSSNASWNSDSVTVSRMNPDDNDVKAENAQKCILMVDED